MFLFIIYTICISIEILNYIQLKFTYSSNTQNKSITNRQFGFSNYKNKVGMSSQFENTMSMNSLMDAIYGIPHHTTPNHSYEAEQYNNTLEMDDNKYMLCYNKYQINCDQLPEFLQSLLKHLKQLCLTQSAADNAIKKLKPIINQLSSVLSLYNNNSMDSINYSQFSITYTSTKNPKSIITQFFKQYIRLLQQQTQKIQKYSSRKFQYLTQTVNKQIFTQIMRMACDLKLQNLCHENQLRAKIRQKTNMKLLINILNRIFIHKQIQPSFRLIKNLYSKRIKQQDNFVASFRNAINRLNYIGIRNKRSKMSKGLNLWRINTKIINVQEESQINNNLQHFICQMLPDVIQEWKSDTTDNNRNRNCKGWQYLAINHLKQLLQISFANIEGISIYFDTNPKILQYNTQNSSLEYSLDQQSHRSLLSQQTPRNYLNKQIKYSTDKGQVSMPFCLQNQQQSYGIITICWNQTLPLIIFNKMLKILEMSKSIMQEIWKIGDRLQYYVNQYKTGGWEMAAYQMYMGNKNQQNRMITTNYNTHKTQPYAHTKKTIKTYISDGKISNTSIGQLQIIPQESLYPIANHTQNLQQILATSSMLLLQIYHYDTVNSSKIQQPCIQYFNQSLSAFHRTPLQPHIITQILKKLSTTSSFILKRGKQKYIIKKIGNQGCQGFCRCLFANESQAYNMQQLQYKQYIETDCKQQTNQINQYSQIIDCLVPLVLNSMGKVGCLMCGVQVKNCIIEGLNNNKNETDNMRQYNITKPKLYNISNQQKLNNSMDTINLLQYNSSSNQLLQTNNNNNQQQFDISDLMYLRQCKSIDTLQKQLQQIFSSDHKFSRNYKLFIKLFYQIQIQNSLSSTSDSYIYIQNWATSKSNIINYLPKSLALGHTYYHNKCNNKNNQSIQSYNNSNYDKIVKIIQKNPTFHNYTLHIYEQQKINQFIVLPYHVKKSRCLFMIGTYDHNIVLDQIFKENVEKVLSIVSQNKNIFAKEDIYQWAVRQIEGDQTENKNINMLKLPDFSIKDQGIIQKSLQISQETGIYKWTISKILTQITKQYNFIDQFMLWKWKYNIKNNKLYSLTQNIKQICQLPYINKLFQSPLHSHHKVVGSHFLIRHSKIYGPKLRQKLSYIPTIADKSIKKHFAEYVLSQSSNGQTTDNISNSVTQYLLQNNSMDNSHSFISIPIQISECKKYLLILTYNKNQHKISQNNFVAFVNYLTQLLTKIIKNRQNKFNLMIQKYISTHSTLEIFNKQINYNKVKTIVSKFRDNYLYSKDRCNAFANKCTFFIKKMQHRDLRYVFSQKLTKQQYLLKKQRQQNAVRYFAQYTLLKIFGLNALDKKLQKNRIKLFAAQRLTKNTQNIVIKRLKKELYTLDQAFNKLKTVLEQKTYNKKLQCTQGFNILQKWIKNYQKRNYKQIFYRNHCSIVSIQRGFELFKEQFILLLKDIGSYNACINLLQKRLQLLLSQYYVRNEQSNKNWEISVVVIKGDTKINVDFGAGKGWLLNQTLMKEYYIQNGIIIGNSSFIVMLKKVNKLEQNNQEVQPWTAHFQNLANTSPLSHTFPDNFTQYQRKLIKNSLQQILPQWQQYHTQQNFRKIKILNKYIKKLYLNNLQKLFKINNQCVNKENIDSLNSMQQKVQNITSEIKKHEEKQYVNKNAKNKQSHKQEMEESNKVLASLESQAHKLNIQQTIKSKTNSMYKILRYISSKQLNQINNKQTKYKTQNSQKIVKKLQRQAYQKSLPLFLVRVQRIVNGKINQYKKQTINMLVM